MNNNNLAQCNSGASTIEMVSTILLILLAVTNLFQPPINMAVLLICCVGWIFNMYRQYNIISANDQGIIKLVILLGIIEIVYVIIGLSEYSLVSVYTFRIATLGMSIATAVYFLRICSYKQVKVITAVIIASVLLSLYQCFIQGRTILTADRQDETAMLAGANVSSSFMLFSIICFVYFLHSRVRWTRIAALALIVLATYTNFFILQRATNVIFTIVAFGFVIIFNFKQNTFIRILLLLICIATYILIAAELYIPMLDWVASLLPDRVGQRINEISIAMQYEDINASSGSLSGRNRLMSQSLQTFFSSPFNFVFGVGEHPGVNKLVGNHSYFLDMLAKYGIIGGVVCFSLFKKQYRFLSSFVDRESNHALFNQAMVVFAFYILRNFYGNVSFDCVIVQVLLLLPLMLILLKYQKENI